MSFDPDSTNDNILDNNHQWPYCQIPSPYAAYQHVVSEAHAAVEYDSTGHTTLNTPSYGGGSFIPVPPYRTALKGGFFPRSQSNHQTVSEPCLKGTSQTRIALENFAPLCPARQILASHPQPMRTGVIKSKKLPKHSSSARMIRFRMCDEDKRLRYVIFLLEQLHKDIICSSLCRLIDELIPKRKSRLPYQSSFQGAVIEAPFFWPKGIEWKSVHHQKKEVVLPLMAYLLRLYWSPELWMAFNHDITDFALQHVEWPKLVTRVLKSTYEERARSTKLKHAVQLPVIEDLRNFIIAECHLVQNGFGASDSIEYIASPSKVWAEMVDPFEHILLRPWQSQGTIAANVDRAPQQCTTPSSSSASGPSTPESFDWLPSHWTTSTTRPAHPVQVTRDFHQFNDESSQVHQMQQKRQPSMQLSCRNPTQDLPQYGLSFLGGQPESSEPINSHAQMHLVDHMFPMSVQQPATQAQSQNYDPLMSLT